MICHCKALGLEFTDCEDRHDLTSSSVIIPSQTSNLKHVEILRVSDKPTNDTSLESS